MFILKDLKKKGVRIKKAILFQFQGIVFQSFILSVPSSQSHQRHVCSWTELGYVPCRLEGELQGVSGFGLELGDLGGGSREVGFALC